MKCKVFNKNLTILALALMALALTAGSSFAVDLVAIEGQWTPPGVGATPVTMWGFVTDTGQACNSLPTWDVGPELTATAGDTLTINLRNCLPEEVSIVIPGQAAIGTPVWVSGRVQSFTDEAAAGGTASYTWTGIKDGTYLYQSGTHPAKQVQMGLYGALKIDFAVGTPNQAYEAIPYDTEVVLLYSEIDPALHDPVPSTAQPTNYKPQYFFVNGNPYEDSDPALTAGNVSQDTLIRLLNAGLKTHVPTLLGAYMRVIAEDGNLYPYAREQYSVLLAAGKTMDAIWTPKAADTYALYDRRHHLTTAGVTGGGMLTFLDVQGNMPPAITSTPVTTGEEDIVYSYYVEAADPDAGDILTFSLDTSPTGMTIGSTTGLIQWTPAIGDAGDHSVTVRVTDNEGLFATQTFTITISLAAVNHPPEIISTPVTTGAEGVVYSYDVEAADPDIGDMLTFSLDTSPTGMTIDSVTGLIQWTPAVGDAGDHSVTVQVTDNGGLFALFATQTFTITVATASANVAPVAQDDFASTPANSAGVTINVLANDYDPNDPSGTSGTDPGSTIDPATVTIVTKPTQKGKATANADGTITYVPKRNFRGTDVFTYTVNDDDGATSNAATVRVNVL